MAIVGRSIVDSINQVYLDVYNNQEPDTVPSFIERENLFFEIGPEVKGKRVNVAWMRRYVRMRLWVGEREVQDEEILEFYLRNAKYEATMRTEIEDIEDGVYIMRGKSDAAELRDAYFRRKTEEFLALLAAAFTDTNTLDGVPLFSTAHPVVRIEFDDSRPAGAKYKMTTTGTWSNKTTDLLDEDALWAARLAFMQTRDYQGQPTGAVPDLLVVGPSNERTARTILENSVKTGGVENETRGLFRLLVEPRITDGKWYLFSTRSGRRKPFVFWNRVSPQLQMLNGQAGLNPGADVAEGAVDYYTFNQDAILHGVRARMGFAYGVPELVYGSDASGS